MAKRIATHVDARTFRRSGRLPIEFDRDATLARRLRAHYRAMAVNADFLPDAPLGGWTFPPNEENTATD